MEEQNFSTLIEFINAMEVREDDEEFKNPVDLMFDALEAEKPNHFAVRQYKKYLTNFYRNFLEPGNFTYGCGIIMIRKDVYKRQV